MRYVLAAVAVVTCPCLLPIWLTLLGSTAIGTAMTRHTGLALLTLTALFAVSGWGALRSVTTRRPPASAARRPKWTSGA